LADAVCQTHKLTKNPCEERSDEAAEKHAHISRVSAKR